MMKLPVCPHCKAKYYYKDVVKCVNAKTQVCHNCKKEFMVKTLKGKVIYFLVVAVILVALNIIMFQVFNYFNFLISFIITFFLFILSFLFLPFTVRFK